jgi:hypothetical protein
MERRRPRIGRQYTTRPERLNSPDPARYKRKRIVVDRERFGTVLKSLRDWLPGEERVLLGWEAIAGELDALGVLNEHGGRVHWFTAKEWATWRRLPVLRGRMSRKPVTTSHVIRAWIVSLPKGTLRFDMSDGPTRVVRRRPDADAVAPCAASRRRTDGEPHLST